ncbi:MAG: hypothetical protein J0H43_08160 [Actinobacteria bacterium]|nr:hypothetical protein [Actinomycetota bacterium]
MRTRLLLGVAGAVLAAYGVWLLLDHTDVTRPRELVLWLAGGVALHDGVIAPVTLLVGAACARWLPGRARRYVQGTAVAIALVALPALLLIDRRGTQPPQKALLRQDYAGHLLLIAGVLAAAGLLAYLVRVGRDQRTRRRKLRPSDSHDST